MDVAAALDTNRSEAFSERMMEILNSAALALMVSVGHRSGLFDALAGAPPVTSLELAMRAGRDERYVREWLGAMATGGIVEYDASSECYVLPPEHAAWLSRAAAPNNMAVFTQYVAVLGAVEDDVVKCFEHGGGVPYSRFNRFAEVMAEDSGQTVLAALDDHILPLVPGLELKLEAGIDVLDVGCGLGRAMIQLAERFPKSRFTGYDFVQDVVSKARNAAAEKGLTNVSFEVRDCARINECARYDLITAFDAVHDQVHPERVLQGIHRALRPDGTFLMQDIRASSHVEKNLDHPIAPFLYTISTMHCMTVSLAGDGAGLGTCWGEERAVAMLQAAGFRTIEVKRLEHDIQNNFYVVRPNGHVA